MADELDKQANETLDALFKKGGEAGSVLWNIRVTDVETRKQTANMLRQQADRIAELEKTQKTLINDRNRHLNHAKELLKEKQSEPVAWLYAEEYPDSDMEGGHVESFDFNQPSKYQKVIWEKPLYTTPQDQSDRIAELEKEVENLKAGLLSHHDIFPPQTKPLSDDEIEALWTVKHPNVMSLNKDLLEFARAIEAKVRGM